MRALGHRLLPKVLHASKPRQRLSHPSQLKVADSSDVVDPSEVLCVMNLATTITEEALWRVFFQYGAVVQVKVVQTGGQGKLCTLMEAFGYVKYMNISEAKRAKSQLHGRTSFGINFNIGYAANDIRIFR